jgi:hypothetical protein
MAALRFETLKARLGCIARTNVAPLRMVPLGQCWQELAMIGQIDKFHMLRTEDNALAENAASQEEISAWKLQFGGGPSVPRAEAEKVTTLRGSRDARPAGETPALPKTEVYCQLQKGRLR